MELCLLFFFFTTEEEEKRKKMEERSAYQSVGFTYSDDAPKEESALDKSGSVTKGGAEDKFIPSESVPESIALV